MPSQSTHLTPRQHLGARGEDRAAAALIAAGYQIVARDVRVSRWQIDILAEEGEDLVIVEVKTRRGQTSGTPAEAVTTTKQRNLIAAAQTWLEHANTPDRPFRIDVVAIALLPGGLPQVEIIRHAVGELAL